MCNPLLIGAGVAAAGGAIANRVDDAKRTNKAIGAANEQSSEELARQQQFSQQAYGNLDKTLSGIQDPSARLDTAAAGRVQSLGDIVNTVPTFGTRADAPDIVQQGFDAQRGAADARTAERNTGLARVGGLGDLISGDQSSVADTGAINGQIGQTAGRSYAVNQIERQSAFNNANRRPAMTLGDVLQLASLVMSAGSSGLFTGAGAAAGAAHGALAAGAGAL